MSDWHKHLRRLEVASAADMPEWQTKWQTEWQIQWQTEWQTGRQTYERLRMADRQAAKWAHATETYDAVGLYAVIKTALFSPFAYKQYEWDLMVLMRLQVLRDGNKIRDIWGVRTQRVWDCKRAQDWLILQLFHIFIRQLSRGCVGNTITAFWHVPSMHVIPLFCI